jgi:N-carbamoyl-L-amino-acid hydrolase
VLGAPDNFDPSITYGAALNAIGWAGVADPAMARKFGAYYEAHIEQGPILEGEGIPIGIVTHCIGVEQWTVMVTGRDGHVGSPMAGRKDALAAAAELVLALERVAIGTGGMATATRLLTLQPDARGNIPSLVRFAANIRHPDPDGNERMTAAFNAAIAELTARRDVQVEIERVGGYPRVPSSRRHCSMPCGAAPMPRNSGIATCPGRFHRMRCILASSCLRR